MSETRLLPQKPDGGHAVIRQTFLGKALNSWNPGGSRIMSLFLLYFPGVPVSTRVLCGPAAEVSKAALSRHWTPCPAPAAGTGLRGPGGRRRWLGDQEAHGLGSSADSDLLQARQTSNTQRGNLPPASRGAEPVRTKCVSSEITFQRWLWGRNGKEGLEEPRRQDSGRSPWGGVGGWVVQTPGSNTEPLGLRSSAWLPVPICQDFSKLEK